MADIYDILIIRMTKVWYRAVLERCRGGDDARHWHWHGDRARREQRHRAREATVIVGIDYESVYIKKAA